MLNSNFTTDPTRIIHAIIVGVSFLGAGTILKDSANRQVENLTTAATVLVAATIGISIALNKYYLALGIATLVLFVNWILDYLQRWFEKQHKKWWPW